MSLQLGLQMFVLKSVWLLIISAICQSFETTTKL